MKEDLPAARPLPGLAWWLLLAVYGALAGLFSVIQPLGRTPDERAHVQYAAFLAEHHRLPLFHPQGGGEAGYEAQHPPLYYLAAALVYRLAAPLAPRWRWHVLRWATILIGVALFWVCRRFFGDLWPQDPLLAFSATATVVLMPLTLLYTAYVNPDGLVLLWTTLALEGAWRASQQPATPSRSVWLGVWAGLALLTKLSGLPALLIALVAHVWAGRQGLGRRLALTLGPALLLAGPWYARNALLYGSPFIHTAGKYGSGLENAFRGGFGFFAWLTWRETFLSTWAQRGWFPPGFWTVVLYGTVFVAVGLATVGLARGIGRGQQPPSPTDDPRSLRWACHLAGLLIGLTFLGHQWAYWTIDVEFNAGGRYLLAAMAGIALLLLAGLAPLGPVRRVWLPLWLLALITMNVVSAQNIVAHLNPRYAPGWQIFEFPPGEGP
jgi:4-amino-4-deoxy-L-arabinose transferase-like glycosyltransferase